MKPKNLNLGKYLFFPVRELVELTTELIHFIVFRWPHTGLGLWLRIRLALAKGATLGKGVRIGRGVEATWGLVTIGHGSILADNSIISLGPEGKRLIIGNDTLIGPQTYIRNMNHVFARLDVPIIQQGHEGADIIIGNGVWIGARCILLAGAKIGDHCVVAAGSVISNEIAPYSIAVGNPARVVKKR